MYTGVYIMQNILSNLQGIDLNLGCPQIIAKRGHFGSYLQDEWDLITRYSICVYHRKFDVLLQYLYILV